MNDQLAIKKFITDNIDRHKQFALATVDEQGKPWTVCLNLTHDDQFNIIWKSVKTTEHSRHIQAHPDVAICIFSETDGVGDFGLYMKARAREVTDVDEIKRLIDIRFTQKGKPTPDVAEFQGDAPARLYYAEVTEAWVNDDRHLKQPVDLDFLRQQS